MNETELGDYANYWSGKRISRQYLQAAGNHFRVEGNMAIATGES
jgi:hypothetical protein